MVPTALWHCWRRAQKRNNDLCQQFSLGESCTPALAMIPDTSVPPCMPLVPFKLLPWFSSSKGMSLSKSMCGLFKRNCLGLQKFLPLTLLLLGFCNQKLWGLIFLALEPLAEGPGMDLGLLTPKLSLLNIYPPHLGVGPACLMSPPLLPVWMGVFPLIP